MEPIIQTAWNSYRHGSGEDYYITQFNALLHECSQKDCLPFFHHKKSDMPENMLNRNSMTDINKTAAELHAAYIGSQSTQYVFGADAVALGLQLDTTKNTQPLLVCAHIKYTAPTPLTGELAVADSGTKEKYQYMYNVEQFDERSQKRLIAATKEQTRHQETKTQREREASEHAAKNKADPEVQRRITRVLEENAREEHALGLSALGTAVRLHNEVQRQGNYKTVGGLPSLAEEIVAKQKLKEEIAKTHAAIRDGIVPKTTLMRVIYKEQAAAERICSKDFSYEEKHTKHEHAQMYRSRERGMER